MRLGCSIAGHPIGHPDIQPGAPQHRHFQACPGASGKERRCKLHAFFDVVQSDSMAKAAAQLRVKQPSVSNRSPKGIRRSDCVT
jgi:hypothetical protein